MTPRSEMKPALIIGGSGVVGTRAVKTLRMLQPDLPIWIGGRDLPKAEALAREVGSARALAIDLKRADLGLPPDAAPGAVVVLMKDDSLQTLRFAQARGAAMIGFSNWSFDIAPEIAHFIHFPTAPLLLLGHVLGGTVTLAALHFAREFRRLESIELGLVFDSDDHGGPATAGDFERIANNVPHPLVRSRGRWLWAQGDAARRRFRDVWGTERDGQALSVLDVPTLAAATSAASVRLDFAVRDASERAGEGPSHSVSIELAGERRDGGQGTTRYAFEGRCPYSLTSADGLALATERLLGLSGGAPVGPGLYHPDRLLDPEYVVERLRELGIRIERQ